MIINTPLLLQACDVKQQGVWPFRAHCGLCHGDSTLECRSVETVICHKCSFRGSLVSYLASKNDTDIQRTVDDAAQTGLLSFQSNGEYDTLVKDARLQYLLSSFVAARQSSLEIGVGGGLNAILSSLNMRNTPQAIQALSRHLFPVRASDILDNELFTPLLGPHHKELFKWWGKYTALAIPAWAGAKLTGLWLITTRGWRYFPFIALDGGVGFGCLQSADSAYVVVVDTPITALRYTLWSSMAISSARPFVVLNGKPSLESLAGKRIVYFGGSVAHYLAGLESPSALGFTGGKETFSRVESEIPFGGNYRVFEQALIAAPANDRLCCELLLSMPEASAAAALSQVSVSPAAKARLIARSRPDESSRLSSLLDTRAGAQSVVWGEHTITDTEAGWLVNKVTISAAKLYVQAISVNGDIAYATGTVVFRAHTGVTHSLPFREKVETISDNPGKWLQRFVTRKTATVPYVDARWSKKLLEVAQLFTPPVAAEDHEATGWSEDTLRLPMATITPESVVPAHNGASGPACPVLEDSTPHWRAFESENFSTLALILIANAFRRKNGLETESMIVVNDPQAIMRYADAMAQPLKSATAENLRESADYVFPMPLSSRVGAVRLSDYNSYVIASFEASVATGTLATTYSRRVRFDNAFPYLSLPVVLLALRAALSFKSVFSSYLDVAQAIIANTESRFIPHSLLSAARKLDAAPISGNAAKLLQLLVSHESALSILETPAVIRISRKALTSFFSSLSLSVHWKDLIQVFQDARFLIDSSSESLSFSRISWDFYRALQPSGR